MKYILIAFLFLYSKVVFSCAPLLGIEYMSLMPNTYFDKKRAAVTPIVNVTLSRAKEFVKSCRQPSYIVFEIKNAEKNPNAGYRFKIHSGDIGDLSFPEDPVVLNSLNYFSFSWLESYIELNSSVQAKIEIFAVLPNGNKSQSVFVDLPTIKSPQIP